MKEYPPAMTCIGCKIEKPIDCFALEKSRAGNPVRRTRCRSRRVSANSKRYHSSHVIREKFRSYKRQAHTGWTREEFESAWIAQGGLCANKFCQVPLKREGRWIDSVCADHDHTTGQKRGLICCSCNRTLGHARESKDRLEGLVDYLYEYEGKV